MEAIFISCTSLATYICMLVMYIAQLTLEFLRIHNKFLYAYSSFSALVHTAPGHQSIG